MALVDTISKSKIVKCESANRYFQPGGLLRDCSTSNFAKIRFQVYCKRSGVGGWCKDGGGALGRDWRCSGPREPRRGDLSRYQPSPPRTPHTASTGTKHCIAVRMLYRIYSIFICISFLYCMLCLFKMEYCIFIVG